MNEDGIVQPYRGGGPGRLDVNGEEWWACDPYPTWYRWDGDVLRTNHAAWVPDDPLMAERKAQQYEAAAEEYEAKAQKLREQADNIRHLTEDQTASTN